ncbi:hypothetical protein F4827_004778 [Paraburkholderia bannensis]|uniref:ATPase AAA-type core domain-containing protein n=1 Tax=Paraburkholderia bannensis TaxID=765414 RepID=A0A7W9U0P7_9BURK|nr:hypothetical protein [Paraburkholderia sp. WP4_3_2]MBB6104913.1 hypothetical protein [Paraburkholderia bannensis]
MDTRRQNNTIIIATSNVGSQLIQDDMKSDSKQLDYPELRDRLMEILRHHFVPEFLNRVDDGLRDHRAQIGYAPEFGARMLKRKTRLEVESQLANALLRGDVRDAWMIENATPPPVRGVALTIEAHLLRSRRDSTRSTFLRVRLNVPADDRSRENVCLHAGWATNRSSRHGRKKDTASNVPTAGQASRSPRNS